jgi:hypothetical protein
MAAFRWIVIVFLLRIVVRLLLANLKTSGDVAKYPAITNIVVWHTSTCVDITKDTFAAYTKLYFLRLSCLLTSMVTHSFLQTQNSPIDHLHHRPLTPLSAPLKRRQLV